jgi:hypothetical protein
MSPGMINIGKPLRTWLALLVLGLATTAQAQLPEPVARALVQAAIPEASASLYVQEIGADRPR